MEKISVNFIGCGKLGKAIALLLETNEVANVVGILNSSLQSAQAAAKEVGVDCAFDNFKALPQADIYFITTKDDLIEQTTAKLLSEASLKEGAIVLHCSGSLSSDVLKKAKEIRPETVRIVLSGYTELNSVTAAINEGAVYKFLTKPWNDEQLQLNIAEAFHHKYLSDENLRLQEELKKSNQAQELYRMGRKIITSCS